MEELVKSFPHSGPPVPQRPITFAIPQTCCHGPSLLLSLGGGWCPPTAQGPAPTCAVQVPSGAAPPWPCRQPSPALTRHHQPLLRSRRVPHLRDIFFPFSRCDLQMPSLLTWVLVVPESAPSLISGGPLGYQTPLDGTTCFPGAPCGF